MEKLQRLFAAASRRDEARQVSSTSDMSVRFWGVRGSIASPGPDTMRYGANTPCVELRCGEHIFILDAGTGLRPLGRALAEEGSALELDILCSHTHIDHICGFPFFAPCYQAGNRIRVWGGHAAAQGDIGAVFQTTMSAPLFPSVEAFLLATIDFANFSAGDVLKPYPDVVLRTAPLNHPGGATGYRIEWGGKALAYLTDTEHSPGQPDANVLALADHAEIMIYDANYTDEDYAEHVGWGHSTWQEAIKLAQRAAAKTVVIFHHDPTRTDAMLDAIGVAARQLFPAAVVAREGLVLTV
jgi:phosphoribosyl 1,2-cyclic phosphodiesterase